MERSWIAVCVRQKSMHSADFDDLCDDLKRHRLWCMDYRMLRDFDTKTNSRFWMSCSMEVGDITGQTCVLGSVRHDVDMFCSGHKLPRDSVSVDFIKLY